MGILKVDIDGFKTSVKSIGRAIDDDDEDCGLSVFWGAGGDCDASDCLGEVKCLTICKVGVWVEISEVLCFLAEVGSW